MTEEYSMKLSKIVIMKLQQMSYNILSEIGNKLNQKRDTKAKKTDQRRKETRGMQWSLKYLKSEIGSGLKATWPMKKSDIMPNDTGLTWTSVWSHRPLPEVSPSIPARWESSSTNMADADLACPASFTNNNVYQNWALSIVVIFSSLIFSISPWFSTLFVIAHPASHLLYPCSLRMNKQFPLLFQNLVCWKQRMPEA